MENSNNMEFTVTRQYIVVSRDYVDDGSYDEDIIGATGDLLIANFLAAKEAKHQEEVYGMELTVLPLTTYNGFRYKLTSAKGLVTKVFVRRVNYFERKENA